jgi:hypothetical protein
MIPSGSLDGRIFPETRVKSVESRVFLMVVCALRMRRLADASARGPHRVDIALIPATFAK